ncbi:hypothetical protein POTOM_003669 [Populus tomentosa]|uniref:Fatty acid desaturase domain-containing protein n=1 Tax=Populus tomentosa TaxID=118781 RepID=A0A8X8D502_POPTO|nr:hypothetical protein POTOM_003669 [Populus tomentosa]
MLFMTSPSAFSSATLPSHISTSYHPLLPKSHGPSTGFSKAAFSPVFGSLLMNVATTPSVTTRVLTTRHRRHHSNTGSLERDEVFVPKTKSRVAWYSKHLNNPPGRALSLARGALATMDRDYGILNKVFHNMTDTHVAHHLFSNMPHYHAMEATKAIKPILGEFYQFDDTPIYKALWREAKECLYVEPDDGAPQKGVFWYRNEF